MAPRRRSPQPVGIAFVRRWLPILLVFAAAIVLLVGPRGLAPGLLMTAMFVIVADWIIRFAMSSQDDRDVEAAARRRFTRSGHWPDESGGDEAGDAPGDEHATGTGDADRSPHDAPHRSRPPHGGGHPPRSRRGTRRR